MIKTLYFSCNKELDKFINENELTKDDIIQIMAVGEEMYPSFHLTYTIPEKPEKD